MAVPLAASRARLSQDEVRRSVFHEILGHALTAQRNGNRGGITRVNDLSLLDAGSGLVLVVQRLNGAHLRVRIVTRAPSGEILQSTANATLKTLGDREYTRAHGSGATAETRRVTFEADRENRNLTRSSKMLKEFLGVRPRLTSQLRQMVLNGHGLRAAYYGALAFVALPTLFALYKLGARVGQLANQRCCRSR